MIGNFAIPKQAREQRQGMLCKGGIHKWPLPFESLKRAATRFIIVVQSLVYHFGIQFQYCPNVEFE